jgi:hypothetical protein
LLQPEEPVIHRRRNFAVERDYLGTGFAAADHLKCAGRDAFEDGIGNRTCGLPEKSEFGTGPVRPRRGTTIDLWLPARLACFAD